jgi:branched-chain amino acid transport system permease protein
MSDYVLSLIPFISINVLLAVSLNLTVGYTGLMAVTQGSSMGVGAYGAAVLATRFDLNIVPAIAIGAVLGALVGILFMVLVAQLGTDDFILASFAFQMSIIALLNQWSDVTGGTLGLAGIPQPQVGGAVADTAFSQALVSVVICGLAAVFLFYLGRARWALILRAMRESERAAEAVGKNTKRIKVSVFAVSSGFAALAGGIYASVIGIITPSNFDITQSILIIAFLLVGGIGRMWGAALGAAALYLLPELIQHFGLIPSQYAGPLQQVIYGVIIALFVVLRPVGILPEKPLFRLSRRRSRDRDLQAAGATRSDSAGVTR